jgi:hypothetical protein
MRKVALIAGLFAMLAGMSSAFAWDRRGWEELGRRTVNGRNDVDTIHIGRREGRFSKIAVVVENGDMEIFDMVVVFGDGEEWRPGIRHHFRGGERSRVIDLPGDRRIIRSVTFHYGNTGARWREAHVELWGR